MLTTKESLPPRSWGVCVVLLVLAYAHNTLPYLTMMPVRVLFYSERPHQEFSVRRGAIARLGELAP